MSISSELLTLQNTKQAIKASINAKGGNITNSTPFADYSTAIDNLPSGGSGNPLLTSIDVSDFTGTTFEKVVSYVTDVTIPSGVTSLAEAAFANCSLLSTIAIPSSVTSIGKSVFQNCSGLTSITIPSGVTVLSNFVFENCTGLTSVVLPNNINLSFQYAFKGCTGLTSFTIPSGVTTIGVGTFYGCSGLTSITIPSGVTAIQNYAFENCTGLTSVVLNSTTPPTLGSVPFNNTNNCPIYVPAESVATYKAASGWSTYASRIYPITQVATVDGNPVYNYDLRMTSTDTITSENMEKMPAGTSVEFAEGLTNIATGEINYQEVILPSTFTGFGDSDMIGSSVTTITSNAVTPPSAFRNQLGGSGLTAIYVPSASVDTYKAHAAWTSFSSIIQAIQTE